MNKKSFVFVIGLLMVASLVLGACQPQTVIQTVEVEKEVEKVVQQTVVVEVEKVNVAENFKLAAIFPGVITDADYNTLGYVAATEVQTELGVEMAYSEAVPVPDAGRVMREYIDGGYNIIYAHGNQFIASALELAAEFPEVAFVLENDGPVADAPANVWVIDRMFNVPYYVLGYIAARSTQTGKIAYLGGLELPFAYQELHAIDQALADNNLEVEINRVFTGDFNDPTKGRQFADQLIADGNDYIMGSMNLGMFGLFEAAKAASTDTKKILTSAKYTDKKSFAPNNYVTSCLYDFATPVKFAVEKILTGELGGYTQIAFGSGVKIQQPLMNVDPALDAEVTQMVEDITSGKIEVVKDSSKYE